MLNSGNGVNNEHDFFDVTLSLRNKYAIVPALAAAGIVPDSNTALELNNVKNAFKSYYGSNPQVQCEGNSISGWVVCFNKSLSPMDCPTGQDTCPSGSIYFNTV
jgi:ribonuclease I